LCSKRLDLSLPTLMMVKLRLDQLVCALALSLLDQA